MSETREGFLDLNDLDRSLIKVRSEGVTQMIGCFSAASCITGVLADDVATTLLLHQYGALSIWDYTTAGNDHARADRRIDERYYRDATFAPFHDKNTSTIIALAIQSLGYYLRSIISLRKTFCRMQIFSHYSPPLSPSFSLFLIKYISRSPVRTDRHEPTSAGRR